MVKNIDRNNFTKEQKIHEQYVNKIINNIKEN